MKFRLVGEGEICKVIAKMTEKSSSGLDGISNTLLKKLAPVIKGPLCMIINASLRQGIFPNLMKLAKVIPLFKGGERDLPDNYRPISLLPVISKVLEKIVYLQTTEHLDECNVIYPKQFGFRKNHSTSDAITTLVVEILGAFNSNLMLLSIFVDLKKAFDTVSHSLIVEKLYCLGIQDITLQWFKSYPGGREQQVMLNDSVSAKAKVRVGIPQGSLLGVLLFQILINDLPKCLKFCSSILYADDTTIYCIGKSVRFPKV